MIISLSDIPQSADLVPLKSLWESASSSEASSTTLRPPPIRRGVLPKEGSFPRLKCPKDTNTETYPQSERSGYVTFPSWLRFNGKPLWGVDEIQNAQVVLWLQVLSTLVIFVTHLTPGSGK